MHKSKTSQLRQPPSNPSQEDIAEHLGISAMTVSRALRGLPQVNAATRKKIEDTARELGYRPNPMLQVMMTNMRRKRKDSNANIAWVDYFRAGTHSIRMLAVIEGARQRADELGYGLEVIPAHTIPNKKSVKRVFKARCVYGAIIGPIKNLVAPLDLPWDDYAFAAVGRSLQKPILHYTVAHYAHSMNIILQEAIKRGYQRISLLCRVQWDQRTENAGIMVYRDFMSRVKETTLLKPEFYEGWEEKDYQSWFKKNNPDLVISDYNSVAENLATAGINIYQKPSFITLTWREEQAHITGISLPYPELGSTAIDLITGQLLRNERGIPRRAKGVHLAGEWVEGVTAPQKSIRPSIAKNSRKTGIHSQTF